jgi:mersacidin/lichenicidin family type 2 lantibiotic
MSHLDIIRAWKDAEYRNSLTEAQRSLLPENPAGLIELTDMELGSVAGGITLRSPCNSFDLCQTDVGNTHYCCGGGGGGDGGCGMGTAICTLQVPC